MKLTVVVQHQYPDLVEKLDEILDRLEELVTGEQAETLATIKELSMATNTVVQDLIREVQETKDINASVITLINGLKRKLDEAILSEDVEQLRQLSADLNAEQEKLAAAVSGGDTGGGEGGGGGETPVEPAPEPTPDQPAPPEGQVPEAPVEQQTSRRR